MTAYHVGCADFARPRARYVTRLSFVEFPLRAPLPSPKTLAQWQRSTPEGFAYALVAPPSLYGDPSWPLRDAAALRAEVDRFANLVDALGARVAVFRTPMGVSPNSVALKRFEPVLERAARIAPTVVWEPAGLWQREESLAVAEKHGVVVASDPLHDNVEGEAVVYARLRGLGADRAYTMARLEALAESLEGAETAYVVFASANAWREAIGLRKLVDSQFATLGDLEGDDEEDEEVDDEDDGEDGDDDEDEA